MQLLIEIEPGWKGGEKRMMEIGRIEFVSGWHRQNDQKVSQSPSG
jgi:hypothetical protein